jgi:dihydroneopterin aldolase
MEARIYIRDISFYSYHGVLPEEQRLGQEFRVSLELLFSLPAAGAEDNLENTVDYRRAVEAARQVMTGAKRLLLETLAAEIAAMIIKLPRILEVKVAVCKPSPPLPGVQGGVCVEIKRTRGD